ncbi:MAG TPA: sugar ABC transporter substrate-binding protein [Ktedonobacteraceae bacterium]|nr:sugar ABC transporter substrate-binding protein [Ktedonobacteraceae bacterium]
MNDTNKLIQDLTEGKIGRRDFIVRALALGVSLGGIESIMAACGGGSTTTTTSNSTTIKYANWASAESATKTQIDQAIQAFQTQNNVKVNNIAIPFDQILQQLETMTNGGNPPDVMELSGNWPYALGGSGALQPLNSYIGSWRNDAFTNSFEVGTYKGNVYAVPFSISPHGFWYSKDMMTKAGLDATKPPTTMDELNSQMATLRAKLPSDAYPIGIDISKTEYALVGFWPWIWTFGGNPMVDDGKGNVTINWADNGTVAAFQWLQDLVKKQWTPPDQAIKAERELMANGKVAFKLDGPYLTGILGNTNPALNTVAAVNQHFGVTTTPVGPGQSGPVTAADIHNLGMSAQSSNKDLAWKFIQYLTTNKSVLTNYLVTEGIFPHKSDVVTGGTYANLFSDTISQAFITQVIPTMRPPTYGPTYDTAANFVVTALQEIAGGTPVKARLQQLTDEVKTVYA